MIYQPNKTIVVHINYALTPLDMIFQQYQADIENARIEHEALVDKAYEEVKERTRRSLLEVRAAVDAQRQYAHEYYAAQVAGDMMTVRAMQDDIKRRNELARQEPEGE